MSDFNPQLVDKTSNTEVDNVDSESGFEKLEPSNKKAKLSENVESEFQLFNNRVDELELSENQSNGNEFKSFKNHGSKDEESATIIDYEIPKKGFDYPLEQDASDMLGEIDLDGNFPTVTERYFTPYYQVDTIKLGDNVCIRIHSNRICMISLASSHTIFQKNKAIKSCDYKVSDKLDRLKNKVYGKSKHGAQPMQTNSNLCYLTCTDGTSYMVKCCMIGKLVEVNERLVRNPELLKKEPHSGGYIAIILPNLKHLEKTKKKLLTQELYSELIEKQRKEKTRDNGGD